VSALRALIKVNGKILNLSRMHETGNAAALGLSRRGGIVFAACSK
jgi:hypothetical protein